MAFNDLELKRIDHSVGNLCRHLSPPEFADELRYTYEVDGDSVSVYEERPPWDGDGKWIRTGVAQFRYLRSRETWQLYWMRSDLRWHRYSPQAALPDDLPSLVRVVEADEDGAFFG